MTEETITITYWYKKEVKITTYVKQHKESNLKEKSGTIMVKGGSISGEDSNPYETLLIGKTNSKAINITPDSGYRIKDVTINGESIEIKDLVKEDKSMQLPLFENIQEDKAIIVEFEKIPSKVFVKYLEENTEKPVSKQEVIEGNVNDKYTSQEKEIEYYEFVKEKYPVNSEGLITEDEITVIYYYKKNSFNFKVEKEIEKITLNGQDVKVTNKNKTKVEIKYKDINEIELEVVYKIKVTNTGKIEGKAILEEYLPEYFEFIKQESNQEFDEKNDKYVIETDVIKSEETKEYKVCLRWIPNTEHKGESINKVKITKTTNNANYKETNLEDNEDTAIVEIKLKKSVDQVIEDMIEDVVNMPKTGQSRIIYVLVIVITVTCFGIIVCRKRKIKNINNK